MSTRRLFPLPGRHHFAAALVAALAPLFFAAQAHAIPAFARKYGTSCVTCHTVYPKLTPFGEAFRRNGYKFPGNDGDYVKQDQVSLGQEAYKKVFPNAVWPGVIPDSVPIAIGFNGQATLHPDKNSGAAVADNNSLFSLHDLVAEGHIWTGGSFDSDGKITFFGEITFSSEGGVEVEHAKILFNDLLGPQHLFNLIIGRGAQTLTSFGQHSSYVADTMMTPLGVTALFGATEVWNVADQYNGIELNGMAGGRFIYSIGVNAGDNMDVRPTENAYAHVGFKLGGMRLDGEGEFKGADPNKPWAETALTLDVFGYRSASHTSYAVNDNMGNPVTPQQDDTAWTVGGNARFTAGSFELNVGGYNEWHSAAQAPIAVATMDPTMPMITQGGAVKAFALYGEASYIVFPWMVPAVRVEYLDLSPTGADTITDLKIVPGFAFLVRPNLKLGLTAQFERANGAPPGSWDAANAFAAPPPGKTVNEIESINGSMAFAF